MILKKLLKEKLFNSKFILIFRAYTFYHGLYLWSLSLSSNCLSVHSFNKNTTIEFTSQINHYRIWSRNYIFLKSKFTLHSLNNNS
ncbi:hypothetical protein BpHYR1_016068 [Brachionus plicatilis]|uniref:Uncharacterized protein n=1 Tax=Brachionus plicatilis TaxID=10195 RepID=A0A3M7SA20_BRAPC|nr:hypothetical protein BpHYR1_016068 [Brachionus plicatilis]